MKNIPCPEHGDKVVTKDNGEGTVWIPVQGETPSLVNYMMIWWDIAVVFEGGKYQQLTIYWDAVNQVWRKWEDK